MLFILFLYASLAIIAIVRIHQGMYRSRPAEWADLLVQLRAVSGKELGLIAAGDWMDTDTTPRPSELVLFELIGGHEGLTRIMHNSAILIEIAMSSTIPPSQLEAFTVSLMRTHEAKLWRNTMVLRLLIQLRVPRFMWKPAITSIAKEYRCMLRPLVNLYTVRHPGRSRQLQVACDWSTP